MDNKFSDQAKSKSTEELKSIVINFQKCQGALVSAARKELENRGVNLSEEEQITLEENKGNKIKAAQESKKHNDPWGTFNTNWKVK